MSEHQIGDAPVITYYLTDPTTQPPTPTDATVTLTVIDPDGVTSTPTVLHPSTGVWLYALPLTKAGEWTATWAATGPVTDTEQVRLYVLPAVGASEMLTRPAWAPLLEDAAVHIPTRTRAVGVADDYLGTFTADTTPTGEEASRIIDHACGWVLGAVGIPVATAAYAQCRVAAALWAAYWIELAYPERDADLRVYDRLRADAELATAQAAAANTAAGGGAALDPSPADTILPLGSFPDAPAWADVTFW